MIKYILIIGMIFLNLGCVGPRYYGMADHAEMMQHCQLMCDATGVRTYSPVTGTCACNNK